MKFHQGNRVRVTPKDDDDCVAIQHCGESFRVVAYIEGSVMPVVRVLAEGDRKFVFREQDLEIDG